MWREYFERMACLLLELTFRHKVIRLSTFSTWLTHMAVLWTWRQWKPFVRTIHSLEWKWWPRSPELLLVTKKLLHGSPNSCVLPNASSKVWPLVGGLPQLCDLLNTPPSPFVDIKYSTTPRSLVSISLRQLNSPRALVMGILFVPTEIRCSNKHRRPIVHQLRKLWVGWQNSYGVNFWVKMAESANLLQQDVSGDVWAGLGHCDEAWY